MSKPEDSRVMVSDPFARRLMVRYLEKRRADIPALRDALDSGDFITIRDKGHNLYGSGSAYGLDRISELGAALERSANKGDSDRISQLLENLEEFVANVRLA